MAICANSEGAKMEEPGIPTQSRLKELIDELDDLRYKADEQKLYEVAFRLGIAIGHLKTALQALSNTENRP